MVVINQGGYRMYVKIAGVLLIGILLYLDMHIKGLAYAAGIALIVLP